MACITIVEIIQKQMEERCKIQKCPYNVANFNITLAGVMAKMLSERFDVKQCVVDSLKNSGIVWDDEPAKVHDLTSGVCTRMNFNVYIPSIYSQF